MEFYIIRHPGGDGYVVATSFQEAMEKWFEGSNPPMRVLEIEPLEAATARVRRHFDRINKRQAE